MNANVATIADHTSNGATRQADSPPPRSTEYSQVDIVVSSQSSYEGVAQQQYLRRLPSPRLLWSDSEEVSDESSLDKERQSSRELPTRTPGSGCESDPEDHDYRFACPRSRSTEQLSIASESVQSASGMDKVAHFVGYPESEFEEELGHELPPTRSRNHRDCKLLPPNASKTTPYARPNKGTSTAIMDRRSSQIHKKRPLASNTLKGKATPKKLKRTPFEQSSSSEDEHPSGDEGFKDDAGPHRLPSFPPPPAPRQTPVQSLPAASRRTTPRAPPKAAVTKGLGSGLRARLQQAIARKGATSSNPRNESNSITKDVDPTSIRPEKESNQVIEKPPRRLAGGGTFSEETAQSSRLASDNGPRVTLPRTNTQQSIQKKKPQTLPGTQTQASRTRAPQAVMANRPPAYGPFNTSHQRRTAHQMQPAAAPAPTDSVSIDRDSRFGSTEKEFTTPPHLDITTSIGREQPSDKGRKLFTPASTTLLSKSGSPINGEGIATPNQQLPSLVRGRPATSAQVVQANLKAPPRATASGANALQTKVEKLHSATAKAVSTKWPTQTEGTATDADNQSSNMSTARETAVPTDRPCILVGTSQPSQQHQKHSLENKDSKKPMRSNSNRDVDVQVASLNKPARIGGATNKSPSASLTGPSMPAKKPVPSTLQSLLTEVHTADSTGEGTAKNGVQTGKSSLVEYGASDKNIPKPLTSGATSNFLNDRKDTSQSNETGRVAPLNTSSTSTPIGTSKCTTRTGETIAQPHPSSNDGKTAGRSTPNPRRTNTDVQENMMEARRSLPTVSHSGKASLHSSQASAVQPKTHPSAVQHRTTSPNSPKVPLPVTARALSSAQRRVPATLPPTYAQRQATSPVQTESTTITQQLTSSRTPSKAVSSAAPKAPPSAHTEPPASVTKLVSCSTDPTTAATRGPKTHARAPSGPTEDGFDIYIPPAPGASKVVPTLATRDNAAAAPATPKQSGEGASKPNKNYAAANSSPSIRDDQQSRSSASSAATTDRTGVSTATAVHRHSDLPSQVAVTGKTARTTIATGKTGASSPIGGPRVVGETEPATIIPFAKNTGNSVTVAKLKGTFVATQKAQPAEPASLTLASSAPRHGTERADAVLRLPETTLRDRPTTGLAPEPYFEYRIKQKMWPESGIEQDADTLSVGFSCTVLETANRHAEALFTQVKHQYLSSFPVQHRQSSSAHNDDGCLELAGTLATIGWPVRQVHMRIWVERGEVPSCAAALHPPPQFTSFLSKTLYILRLYKLTEVPLDEPDTRDNEEGEIEEASAHDEAAASEAGDDDSSSDSDASSSASNSDPDAGKHNKKRKAKMALKRSPPRKRRRVRSTSPEPTFAEGQQEPATPKRILRLQHQVPGPEVYTTVYCANSAACDLQIEIMNVRTPLGREGQASNAARLRQKLLELAEKAGEERYWRNEFVIGLGGDKMEIVVESIGVCGPRNV